MAARVDLTDSLTAGQVEEFSGRVDAELRAAHSEITQVFLDATRPDPDLARRTAVHVERLRAEAAAAAATAASS